MDINKILIAKIIESVPKNINVADYLMDKLSLGKDSVYRRIRGEIAFTFSEIAKLAALLNYSLDEVIGKSEEKFASFVIQPNILLNPQQTFRVMLESYYDDLRRESDSEKVEVFITCNCVLPTLALYHDNLFKFLYFKWTYQTYELDSDVKFSDIVVPNDIIRLCNEIRKIPQCRNSNYFYIMDKNTYLSMAEQFQYYYKRKIITLAEQNLLKEDLLCLVKATEKFARKGSCIPGIDYNFYLSTLSIESNTVYIQYDNTPKSYFWVYSVNPIGTNHEIFCAAHKKWIDSIKKYSVLITQSNDIVLADFFNDTYSYLNNKIHFPINI